MENAVHNSSRAISNEHSLEEGLVRIGPLMNLPGLVHDLGCDPEPVFSSAGFEVSQFVNPDIRVPYILASKLLARCETATHCEHLGLMLGERANPSSLGVAGFMIQAAPDVRTALRDLVRHLDLHDRGALVTLVEKGRETSLGYAIYLSGVEASDQIYDLSMAVACKIVRGLCGTQWNPGSVMLSRPRPRDPMPYRRFFQAPVRFETDLSALIFPTHWLDQAIPNADPYLYRYLEDRANELHAQQSSSVGNKLCQLLRRTLQSRTGTAAGMAHQLGMHERTLHRRLREEGTTFRKQLEDIRYDQARHLLDEPKLSLSAIADQVGYADSTAFSRAFKRWAGITPSEWRARHRNSHGNSG